MPDRLRIAIDGCGALTAESILPHLAQPDFQARAAVVALADVVPGRAEKLAREYGVPHAFTDYPTMLDQAEADAALVVVPARLHGEHALLAARRGLHVYVQKPVAASLEEARQVIETARQAGVKLVAAPGLALWPLYGQIRDAIRQGEIGRPYLAQPPMLGWGSEELYFPTNPAWFFRPDSGPLRDHGGYGLCVLNTLFGPVRRVAAFSGIAWPRRVWQGQPFPVTGDDNTVLLLDFGNSLYGLLPEAWSESSPAGSVLRVNGLEGSIQGDLESALDQHLLPFGATIYRGGETARRLEVDPAREPCLAGPHADLPNAHVYADVLHLLDCVQEGIEPLAGGAQALHTVAVIEAAFRAAGTGQTQDVEEPRLDM
jgi:predicted dehydrogenase